MLSLFATVLCATQALADGAPADYTISATRVHTETLDQSRLAYTIDVGGTADMDNTATRHHGTWDIAFQNNLRLTIANTGQVPVKNPRLVINGRGRWHSDEAILEEFTQGAKNEQERIYLIWEGLRQNRHHDSPLYGDDEYHDPVKFLNIYGGGFCDDSGKCGSALYALAGFTEEPPFVRALHGHMMCEVWHDGDYQFMDIDQDTFYLDRENRKPISGDTVARDHDYAKREQVYGPPFNAWNQGPHTAASLFGADDGRSSHGVWGYEMDLVLRPSERYEFRWDHRGKTPWQREDITHRYFGNSLLVYDVPLDAEAPTFEPAAIKGFARHADGLVATEDVAALTIETGTPYTICGGKLRFRGTKKAVRVLLEMRKRSGSFKTVWEGALESGAEQEVALDEALAVHGKPPRKDYEVRLSVLNARGWLLNTLSIETDLYAYPIALPRLCVGTNRVAYSDETDTPHEITITHEWQESSNVTAPPPPDAPQRPEDTATLSSTYLRFAWPACENADLYHLRVSRDPELRYPYRPNYDVLIAANSYEVPYRGMFSHGETYYWRLRARSKEGIWGPWGPVWSFTWEGPMVPKNARIEKRDEEAVLHWEANPAGRRSVRYDVYGSDERGFSVNPKAHEMPFLGKRPGNLFASTAALSLAIAGPALSDTENANKAYYRVVAVSENGVESCPSDYAEIERPFLYTASLLPAAQVAQAYACQLDTISSIGDLQYRYIAPGHDYWEAETYRFELVEAPGWMLLDANKGAISGTPGPDDLGRERFRVRVRVAYPGEVPADSKSGKYFQKAGPVHERHIEHEFGIEVQP